MSKGIINENLLRKISKEELIYCFYCDKYKKIKFYVEEHEINRSSVEEHKRKKKIDDIFCDIENFFKDSEIQWKTNFKKEDIFKNSYDFSLRSDSNYEKGFRFISDWELRRYAFYLSRTDWTEFIQDFFDRKLWKNIYLANFKYHRPSLCKDDLVFEKFYTFWIDVFTEVYERKIKFMRFPDAFYWNENNSALELDFYFALLHVDKHKVALYDINFHVWYSDKTKDTKVKMISFLLDKIKYHC